MSEAFSPQEVPTPHDLHKHTELKQELLAEAASEQEKAEIEQTFDPANVEKPEIDLIYDTQFTEMMTAAEHQEEFYSLFPAFDKVMDRYKQQVPEHEVADAFKPEDITAILAELPSPSEQVRHLRSPHDAYEWYKRLGPGELDEKHAGDLVKAAQIALSSTPESRDKNNSSSYEAHLDRRLSGACMLIEAGLLLEQDSKSRELLDSLAQKALSEMLESSTKGKNAEQRELDEWYAMQASMYLANLRDSEARQKGKPANTSPTTIAHLGQTLSEFLRHHPQAEQDVVGLRTEMAVYLLLDNWARNMKKANGIDLSVRKAFPREDAPHDGKRKHDRRSVDVIVTRHNADGSYEKYLIQDKTADAQGNVKTNEDMGYNSQVILMWLRAEDAEQILSVYGDIAKRRYVDSRRQARIPELRAVMIKQSGLAELVQN